MRHNGMESVLVLIIGSLMITSIAFGISHINIAIEKAISGWHTAIEKVIE